MRRGSWLQLLWLPQIAAITAILTWLASRGDEGWIDRDCLTLVIIVWLAGLGLLLMGIWQIHNEDEKQVRKRRRYAFGLFAYSIALNLIIPISLVPLYHGGVNRNLRGYVMVLFAPLAWVGVTAPERGEWVRSIGAWSVLFTNFFIVIYGYAHGEMLYPCWCFRYLD